MGAEHLVVIPAFWRDDKTGEVLENSALTPTQWRNLTAQTERLAHEVRERYGLKIVVHPHADTHIDSEENVTRFDATDSSLVSLCLDTGHYAYCGGDSVKLIETYGERIGYLHLKQVDPLVLAEVRANEVPFGPAVARRCANRRPVYRHGSPSSPPPRSSTSNSSPSSSRACTRARRTSRCRSPSAPGRS